MNAIVRKHLDILWNYMHLGMDVTPGLRFGEDS